MSNFAAVIKSLIGQVFVTSVDGIRRQVFEGDRVFAGEQVTTADGGSVTLEMANGEIVKLDANSSWQAGDPAAQEAADAGAPAASSEFEQALAAGLDPTVDLEPTAAGPGAGGGGGGGGGAGGGHSAVMLSETAVSVDPTIGFQTTGLGTPGFNLIEDNDPAIFTTAATTATPATTPTDTTAPVVTIGIDPITGDDLLNSAELGAATVVITGTVGGDARVGDAITLNLGGNLYSGTVIALGNGTLGFSIPVSSADLGSFNSISASVSSADAAGNVGTATASRPYTVDTTAPVITVDAPAVSNDTTPTISGTTDAPVGSTVTLTITQGSTVITVTTPVLAGGTYTVDVPQALAEGPYTVGVQVTDPAGNTGSATDTGAIDTTAPAITVDAPAITNDTTPTITGTTDAPVGSTVTLTITQGTTVLTTTATVVVGGTYFANVPAGLVEGPYSVDARVTDAAGNTGSANDSGAIDTTAPLITINAPAISNDTTPTISGTTDAPVGSTVTLTITQGSTVITVTTPVLAGGNYTVDVPQALAEGPYTVGVQVTDPAGNTGSATDTGDIDTTAPAITVDAPAITNDTTPTITGTTDAPVGSTVTLTITQGATVLTSTAIVVAGGTYSANIPAGLAEGSYTVDAAVTDAAGNTGSANDSGAIDTTAPLITVDAPAITNDTTPTITGTTDAPVGSTVTLTITQGSTVITVTTPVLAGGTYAADIPQALAEGPYTVGVQVTDPAGNTGSATYTGAIDTTAPAITVDAPAITNDTTPIITGTTDAPVGSTVTLTITQGATVLTSTAIVVAGGTYSANVPAGLAEGSYTVDAAVTDAAGNTGSANDSGAIDTTAPLITVDAPAITNDTTPTITGTTDAPVGSTVTLTITQGATVLTTTAIVVAGGTYSADVPAGLAEGSYTVGATVTDAAGNTGSANDSGAIDITAPLITVDAPAITNDTTPTITGTTDAPVGSTVTLTVTQGNTTFTVTTPVLAGGIYNVELSQPLAEGPYSIDASVTDAAGNTGSANDSGAIDTTAPLITVEAPAITNDTTPTITGTTDAPVGNTVTLTITQGATVLTATAIVVAGGTYSVDAPAGLAEGSYTVDAAVTDAAGNTGSANDSGAIDTTAPLVTVDAPAITNDTTPTITGTTDAPVGSTVTLTITQGTTVLTTTAIVVAGGTYSADVPAALAEGSYTVGATVTDAAGNTGSANDSGAIDTTAPLITVDAPEVSNDTTPTITGTTDAPVGSTVTLTVTQGNTTFTVTTPVLAGGTYNVELNQPLAEGPYSIDASVTDAAGNTGSANDSGAIDTTAPLITVDAPAITNDTTPTITGTTDAPVGSTVTLTITQGNTVLATTATVVAGGTYSVNVPAGLAEGSYTVDAAVTDAAGNTGSANDSGAIDTTAPLITVEAPAITNDTTPTITGTTDAPVGSTVTLTITQGTTVLTTTANVVAGGTYSVDAPAGLAEGSYTVDAAVTDAAGNTGSANDSGAIDITAPLITVDAPAISNDTTPTITGTTDAPVGSTVTLTVTQGNTTFTVTTPVLAGGTYNVELNQPLAEGPYSIDASVTDAAGNTGSANDSGAIDTTAPLITVDAPAITNDTTPTITGTTDAPVGSVVTLTITQGTTVLTTTATVVAGGTYSANVPAGLAEGSYTVDATVTDAAGNTGSDNDSGAIDTTAPLINVDAPAISNDTTPTITGTTDASVGSVVTLTITQGTTVLTTTATVVAGGTYSADVPAGLAEGSYTVNAAVTDAAGNTGSANDSGAIDITAPLITVDTPAISNDTTPTITGTTDAPVGSTVTLTVTQGNTTFTVTTPVLAGGTYNVELSQPLAEGPYSINASVTDAAGNTGSANDSGAIDTTAPLITVDAPAITNDTTPTITGTTDAPVGSTVTLTISQGSTVLTTTAIVVAGGTYSVAAPAGLAEGSYTVNAAVTDAAGNTGSANDSGAIDTTAPLITVDAPAITNDITPTITGTTDAPVGSTVTLTITQGATVLTTTAIVVAGGSYSVDAPAGLAEGSYSVDATVNDAAGNTGSANDSGAIDTTAPLITIDAPAITNDTTPTITGTTDAPVGSVVTLTITQGTTVLTTTAAVVAGGTYSADVPAGLAEGSYTVDAAVTDAAGNTGSANDSGAIDTTSPLITVDAPAVSNDTTPTITGTTDAPVGSTVTLTVTQANTTFTVTTPVLAGGTYNVELNQPLAEGPYSVDATVTDAAGNTGSANDSGAIDTTAPLITVDAPAVTNDTTPTITGTTDAPVGSTVTLTITQGTTVLTTTATVVAGGTYSADVPAGLAEGSYTVAATVTDAAGNTGSANDSGAIDTTAPLITVDAPAITNDTTPTITGTTDAPVGSVVTLTITQGTTVLTTTATVVAGGTYSADVPAGLAEGSYTVGATVNDAAGNTGSANDSGAIDTTAPLITVDAPAITNDTTPTVTGTTDAPVGSTVTLTITQGNTVLATTATVVAGGTYSANVPAGLAEGSYSVDARVTDAAGNTGSANDSGAIDTTAPLITVDAPAITNDTTPIITGTTDAPVGSTVTLTITQGTIVLATTATVVAGGTYSAGVPAGLAEGSYTVDAAVTDAAGNTGSANDSGAIDTTAPLITVDAPAITNDTTPTITGTTDAPVGNTVTLTITQGATVLTATAIVVAGGTYSVDAPAGLAEGSYTVDAAVTDAAGNTGSANDNGAIDTTAPLPTITLDANITADDVINIAESGQQIPVTGTVGGDAKVGDTVTLTVNGKTFTGQVQANNTFSINVPGADLAADAGKTINASISTTDAAGNIGTGSDTETYSVDTTAPTITVDAPAVSNDTTPSITGTTDAPVGSIVTLTLTQNGTSFSFTAPVLADGTYTADVPQALAEGPYTVAAQVTDQAGNTGSATDNGAIDTLAGDTGAAPVVTITEDADNDGVISKAELNGEIDVRVGLPAGAVAGDTLIISNGTTPQTVTLTAAQITAGFVATTFASPGEGNTLTVEATLRDQYGNTSEKGTDTARIDTLAGTTGAAPVVTISEDANNDGVIGQNELSGAIDVRVGLPAGAVVGDTISVTDGLAVQTFTLTEAQIASGRVDTTFANPGEGKTITVEATLQDQFGNVSGKGSDQALVNSNPVAVDDPVGNPYTVTIGDLVSGSATNNWAHNDSNNQQTLIQARDGNGDSATLLQLAVDGNQNALGVAGSPRAVLNQVPDQLEYDPTTGKTESITLNFSGNLNQADFRVSRLIAAEEGGEVGRWVAMYEGVEVASGTFKFSGGGSGTFSLDTGTQVFDSIRFEALPTANGTGDGSDYFLTGFSGSGPASANGAYVVNESQTLVIEQGKGLLNNDSDAQANQTLGVIKINGADVPADGKVALATGVLTVNADGSFNFAANDNNLKSGELKTQSFTYTVGDGYGGTATATATITIIGTEVAPGIGAVSAAVDGTGAQVDEGDIAVFTVSLTNASSTASTFNLTLNPGTATAGSDYNATLTNQSFSNGVTYNATTGQVTVPAGVTSFTVTVPTINDTVSEPTETFSLTVGGKTGIATIIDNDAAPTVGSVSAAVDSAGGQVDEGDNAVFTVNLTNASSTPTSFSLALNAGTATAGSDYDGTLSDQSFSNGVTYNAATGQVTVPAGVTSFTVTVPTINDTVSEPSENFSLTVGGKTGTATIIDNDAAPTVSTVSSAVDSAGGQVDEGDNAVFTVNLTNASSTPTSFSLALNAGTATAGNDYNGTLTNQSFSNGVTYNATTGQVTVPAGVTSFTVSVPTLNDTVHEQTETFSLTVGGQTGTATIIDNDAVPTVSTVSAAVDSTGGQVDEGDNAVFTVNLTNASSTATSFSLALNPGSALPGFDYNAALNNQSFSNGVTYNGLTGVVTVPAGVTSFTVTVPTINDTIAEPTETFTLTVGGKTGTATIIDNDAAPTVSTVSAAVDSTGGQVDEGDNAVFTVNLSNAGSTPTTFSLALNPGTATAGSDYNAALNSQSFSNGVLYNAITGQITVPAGVTSFTVTVPTINDTVSEPTETFSLTVGGKTGTATIIDNDAAPTVSTVSAAVDSAGGQVDEGDNAVFTVNLTNASSTATTFSLALNAGTATAGSDYNAALTNQSFSNGVTYNATTGQVTVPAGVTSFTVTVPTINDTVAEPTETFSLTVGGQTGTATIIDNDAAPTVGSVSAAVDSTGGQVDEGDNAVFTVNLTNASSTPTTFSLALNAGTATAGSDYNGTLTNQSFSNGVTYNATTGQVTVPAGVTSFTVTVPTINDTVSEPTETFTLNVGGKTGTATIIDNDAAPTVSTVSAAVDSTGGQVDEGDNAVFTVNLTNASSTATTFSLALNAGTATAGSDYNAALTNQSFSNGVTYNAATGQVTVPAGVTSFTVTVPTINDTVAEPTETFSLTVGGQTGTATIIDNDAVPTVSTVSSAVDSTGGQVDEGDNAVFTVNLTNASSTPTTFSLALNPGTAVAGSDYNAALTNQSFSNGVTYNAATGQVTVPAGVTSFTVTVPTINDLVSEPTETFSLTVGGQTGTATIIDNDAAPTVSTVSAAVDSTGGQVDEGDNAVFTVNLTNASSTPTLLSLALTPGTAVAGSDYNGTLTNQSFSNGVTYNAATGQVIVPAGVTSFTVTVPTINDTVSEPTETFSLTVGGKTGTATIIDNDPAPTVKTIDVGQPGTADDNVVEGSNLVFNVTLSNASSTPTVLSFSATGTATANVDYKLSAQSFSNGVTYDANTGKITVPAGVTSFSVTVPTLADNVVGEPLETVKLDIGGQSATGGIIDGTPDAKDDSYTKVTGLKAEYYGYNDSSTGAGNDGANLTNLSQVRQFIDSHNPAATFNATTLDYGSLSNASGLGNGTNLQNFLGVNTTTGNGIKANSLSTDPGNTSDAIIKMSGYINLAAGTYQFRVTADDGYSIRINGQVVAEFNNIQSSATATGKSFTIGAANAGPQQIEIIYWDQGGDARLKVEVGQGGTFKVVDSDMLYHVPTTSSLVMDAGDSLTIAGSTLLGNDTDPNGDALSITSVQNASNGTVTLNNGNVVFTPKSGFYGDASFQYTISDGKGGSDIATVTLKVNQPADTIRVAGGGANDNGDNSISGGAGNDVLLGDAGGTLTTLQPATNYNIALLVDTSGSMQGDRMSLTKSALSNFVKTLAGHDGVVNVTLVGFAGDVTLSSKVADLQNGTKLDSLLADIQRLTANGGTNYEAAFKEASAWFDAQSTAGNTKAAGYENLTFFLSDGDPTFYYNGNTTTVSGNGSTTNDQVLLGSLDTFNVLAGKSAVQAIGIGSGVSEKNLSLFDNTTDSPASSYLANGSAATLANFDNNTTGWNNLANWQTSGTGVFSGSVGRSADALMIRDTVGGAPVTATTPSLTIADGTFSSLRFAYGTADTGSSDSLSWKLQQLVQGVWSDVQTGGGITGGNWTTAETAVVGAGTYRLAFSVDDKSNNLFNATMWIDNITRVDYAKVPVGKVEIVNTADELSTALHGGSNANVPVTVGNDTIQGGDGNDIIFGDVINTDALPWGVNGNPAKPGDLHDGAGTHALETFLTLKNGIAPTNADLYDYIRANHETFNVAGDTRGGADKLYGGAGNDILYGQGGNDLLVGGPGDDILFGGAGADTFAWQKGDFGKDVIKDFNVAEGDTIDISSLLQDHSNNLDSYLKLVTDNGSSTLLISTKGEFNNADTTAPQVAAKADVQIDLGQASLPSYDINTLIANHTIKVDP